MTQVVNVDSVSTEDLSPLMTKKRDGRIVEFDSQFIVSALKKAFISVYDNLNEDQENKIAEISESIEQEIISHFKNVVEIYEIQSVVEKELIDFDESRVAEAYTAYRLQKDIARKQAENVDNAIKRFINNDPEIINENANKSGLEFSSRRDLLSGAVSKAEALKMLPKDVANAHQKGDIHFHDMDYSPFTSMTNCSLPNFKEMLENGFTLANAQMDSPKSIETATTQITQIMKEVAGAQYGGQSADRLDEMLAPYAEKNYMKNLKEAEIVLPDDLPLNIAQRIVKSEKDAEPERLHFEKDRKPLADDVPFHDNVSEIEKLREVYAKILTRKNIYDAMQTMEYQINSNRVTTGQTPFVTVGFGLGTGWFEREIQRAIFLNRMKGLGKDHRTAIFPKLVYSIKYGINSDPKDPNYDIKQLALECSTKRIYPDVLFYENLVKNTGSFKAPMGCRSFLQGWINPETEEDEESGRMNLGVVTVNIPRIALESNGNKRRFWRIFNQRMNVVHHALQFRIQKCMETKPENAPVLYENGAFGRLKKGEDVRKLFLNRRATISLGYIGLYETAAVFYGTDWEKDHSYDKNAQKFALQIVKKLTENCKKWEEEEGIHYSVYGTPAESLTDRFNKLDRKKFGNIPGITDHEFYSNSFHYFVERKPTPFEKLEFEEPFLKYSAGGHICYCEYPVIKNNLKALEAVWDYAHKIGIDYLGSNFPVDQCFECGFKGEFESTRDGFKCPECGNHDSSKCDVIKRVCGYLGNPLQRPMIHGRHEEITHREKHMSGEIGRVQESDGIIKEWFSE